jgi:autotransporter-associated beta strand protein
MKILAALFPVVFLGWLNTAVAQPQRVWGVDVSYWNRFSCTASYDGIEQTDWNTAYSTADANGNTRQFAWIRATRGGTTGLSQFSGTPGCSTNGFQETLTLRYDDPEFLRTITRATTAGLFAGPYHYGRPDNAGNTGTDEADHFIEYAGAYMRPGYMMPVYDWEEDASTVDNSSQFAIDLSNRIFARMQIRPAVYIGGSRSGTIESATQSRQDQLAKPATYTPSVVGPAYPMLWNPYYTTSLNLETQNPKDGYSGFYGPWDDYGVAHPWSFWQHSSTVAIPGFPDTTCDSDVSHGDIEYVKNFLVPAVWWSDVSGDWSTLTNWNSGRPFATFNAADINNPPAPYTPHVGAGQTSPFTSYTLPIPRLPGVAGSGPAPTAGSNDTVILERPTANITVTLSSGTYNIRKLYMRETLNLTGGSLTVNYNPNYRPNDSTTVLHGGPISAQFSGPVALSNTASFSVHTLQVDTNRIFTLAGGTLTFNTINLMPHASTPAKILMNGDLTFNPLSNVTALITNGTGAGSSGLIDLGNGTRGFNVGNGASDVDLSINVPISNGGLTKTGAGTLRLSGNNTFAGNVTINGGTLRYGHASGLASSAVVTVNNGGILDMNGIGDSVAALASAAGQTTGVVTQGVAGLTLVAAIGTNTFSGSVIGSGTFIKNGASIQILNGNNSFGVVTVNTGSLLLNGNNTTAGVTVNSGGELGGTGTISGAVSVNSGGTVSPGASIGTLTLNSAPAFDGTIVMEIDGNGGSPVADKIALTSGTLNYGGTLVVSNVGAALLGGETFVLFSAPAYSGALVSSNLPALSSGLNWFTDALVTNGTIKVNRKPEAGSPLTFSNTAPSVLGIPFSALIANATDGDGDPLVLAGVNLITTNGIALTTNATTITYSNNATVNDQFNYIIADGKGGSVTGTVNIVNIGSTLSAEFSAAPVWSGNSVYLQFSAVPGGTYYLERSTNLPPTWVMIWTNVAPPSGVFDYTDNFSDLPGVPESAFYRLSWPP